MKSDGENMVQIFEKHGKLTINDILVTGLQLVDRLETIHKKRYLYKNFSPNNVICGSSGWKQSVIMLVDYSWSQSSNVSKKLLNKKLRKTSNFCSIVDYDDKQVYTYSNDIESLFYMIAYFTRGTPLWEVIEEHTPT